MKAHCRKVTVIAVGRVIGEEIGVVITMVIGQQIILVTVDGVARETTIGRGGTGTMQQAVGGKLNAAARTAKGRPRTRGGRRGTENQTAKRFFFRKKKTSQHVFHFT